MNQPLFTGLATGSYIQLTYGHLSQVGPDGDATPEAIQAYSMLCQLNGEKELDDFLNADSESWYGMFEISGGSRYVALAGHTDINNSDGRFMFAAEWDF
jgi:hypothetical protein